MELLRYKYLAKNSINWSDLEFLRVTRNNRLVNENLFCELHITRGQQEEWYYNVYNKNLDFRVWICYSVKDNCPIGYVQYHIDSIKHHRCEVGYAVSPLYQGQGFGRKIVKWSLDNLKKWEEEIHKVWLTVLLKNEGALKLYSEEGFEIEGLLEDHVYKNGVYYDVYIMSKFI
jgi:RimJ/RimL family protein N-acetyltransferase